MNRLIRLLINVKTTSTLEKIQLNVTVNISYYELEKNGFTNLN